MAHTPYSFATCMVLNLCQFRSHSQLFIEFFTNLKSPQRVVLVVSPIFLSRLCSQLSTTLAYLYQLFFDTTFMPHVYLTANSTPIFNKGDAALPSNYRAISLTCSLCNIMESIVKDQLFLIF